MMNAYCVICIALASASLVAQAPSVRSGVTISKDTVTVGEPFDIRIRVRAPAGATIQFPENPDSSGTIQGRDPRTITTTDTVQASDQTANYRVAAWDIGAQRAIFDDVIVTQPGVANRRIPVGAAQVFVRSVLPADSALRVPKPARPLWEPKAFPWWIFALIAAVLALLIGIWWWRRRHRKAVVPVPIDVYARAVREFNRIEAIGLVDAGERTRFVALVVEVLRDYLAGRYADASLALTSRELVALARHYPAIPFEQLSRVLHEADLAKFAAFSLTEDRARNLSRDARAIVEHEHVAAQPPAQAAA